MKQAQTANGHDGRMLAKNSLWNLAGLVLPLLVAIAAVPLLIRGLGTERFGVLTLVWTGIGYFGLFDMGLGQALTKLVAEKLGLGRADDVPSLVWTALLVMLAVGTLGALVLMGLAPWLAQSALKMPAPIQPEASTSLVLLALALPVVVVTAGLCGVLEAYQRFDLVNLVRVPLGVFSFLGPLVSLYFTPSLVWVVATLMVGRFLAGAGYLVLCLRAVRSLRKPSYERRVLRPLLAFGGWITATNIVAPMMIYMDRFLIAAMVSMAALAYYTTPFEVISRLMVVPMAIVGALFPAFSVGLARDRQEVIALFDRGIHYVFLVLFPLTLIVVALAGEVLEVWLGPEFAGNSSAVLRWLMIGVFINGFARIPFSLIQAQGRPDLTTKLFLAELPVYLVGLWWLVRLYGIEGAAIAWALRIACDTVLLFALAKRILPDVCGLPYRLGLLVGGALILFALCGAMVALVPRLVLLFVTLGLFAPVAWFVILNPSDRVSLTGILRALPFCARS